MNIKPATDFLIGLAGVDYNGYLGVIKDVAILQEYDVIGWDDPNGILYELKTMFKTDPVVPPPFVVLVRMNDGNDRIYLYDESGFYVPEESL